jgi:hypothetical protein
VSQSLTDMIGEAKIDLLDALGLDTEAANARVDQWEDGWLDRIRRIKEEWGAPWEPLPESLKAALTALEGTIGKTAAAKRGGIGGSEFSMRFMGFEEYMKSIQGSIGGNNIPQAQLDEAKAQTKKLGEIAEGVKRERPVTK